MPWEEEVDNNVCGELGAGQAYSKCSVSTSCYWYFENKDQKEGQVL